MPNGHSASGAGMATWFRDVNEENRPAFVSAGNNAADNDAIPVHGGLIPGSRGGIKSHATQICPDYD